MSAYVESSYVEDLYTETLAAAYAESLYVETYYTETAASFGGGGEVVAGSVAASSPLGSASVSGVVPVLGNASAPSPLGASSVAGLVVIRGPIALPSPLGAPKLVGTVVRFELRGEVRDQGVLVNRRVRAYRRSTGALVTEADTAAGLFTLDVGFAADEYYLVPINLDAAAADFAPPCANRVTSVLVMDPT